MPNQVPTPGQQAARRLLAAVQGGRFPHACFVACPDSAYGEALCRQAAALWCVGQPAPDRLLTWPDYTELGEAAIPVDRIRELTAALQKRPFMAGKRCVYIRNAHAMSEIVQNALLKTLEEPPADVLFLLSGNENGLLPTIRSRCVRFLYPGPTLGEIQARLEESGAPKKDAALYAAWGGTWSRAKRLFDQPDYRSLRQEAQSLLKALLSGGLPLDRLGEISKEGEEAAMFMLSLLRDILDYKQGLPPAENPEQEQEIARLAGRLDNRQITALIQLLAEGLERLASHASTQASFTSLFTQIAEEIA